jgi:hypothetical protein
VTFRTSDDCLRGAWAALIRGDTAERDRLCDRARSLMEAEGLARATEKVLSVDFYVKLDGTIIPTLLMARAARLVQ